jgi:hypothetical protein
MNMKLVIIMFICISLTLADDPKPTCPKYSCGNNITEPCAHSTYNATALYQNVVLQKSCKGKEICFIKDADNLYLGNQYELFEKSKVEETLKCGNFSVDEQYNLFKQLPGEKCDKDADCYATKCESGKCAGKKKGEDCVSTSDCLVGNYCKKNGDKSTCAPQEAIGQPCTSLLDCVNTGVCQAGKCITAFSLPAGQKIVLPEGDTPETKLLYCEFFEQDNNGLCYKTAYANNSTTKFVSCQLGDKLKYHLDGNDDLKKIEIEKECGCGYNAEGKGYFPLAHTAGN